MSSDSFQLMGMAERGLLPKAFAHKSRYGTPTYAIVLGSCCCIFLATFDFSELIEVSTDLRSKPPPLYLTFRSSSLPSSQMVNFLYIFAQIIEFAAFLKLRISAEKVHRPFKIPLGTRGCFFMLLLPFLFMLVMLYLASAKTWLVCGSMIAAGSVGHCVMEVSRRR